MKRSNAVAFSLLTLACVVLAAVQPSHGQNALAFDPVLVPLGTVNLEFETALPVQKLSLGVSGWYEYKEVEARWAYGKILYYLFGKTFQGLALGPLAGVLRYYRQEDEANKMEKDTSLMLGAIGQYNWLLGSNDRFLIGVGAAVRTAVKEIKPDSPLKQVDGELRLVAGITF